MLPLKDAIESFNELSEHFDTYILSTSPWENHAAPSDKLKWVKTHLGNKVRKRLIKERNQTFLYANGRKPKVFEREASV